MVHLIIKWNFKTYFIPYYLICIGRPDCNTLNYYKRSFIQKGVLLVNNDSFLEKHKNLDLSKKLAICFTVKTFVCMVTLF